MYDKYRINIGTHKISHDSASGITLKKVHFKWYFYHLLI